MQGHSPQVLNLRGGMKTRTVRVKSLTRASTCAQLMEHLAAGLPANSESSVRPSTGSEKPGMSLCSQLPGLVKVSRARSPAICATCGAAIRHDPHHDAQKSVNTGTLLSRMISLNSSSLTSRGSPMAGNSRLHAPHLPTSERCFAGMRLDLPQEGQFRISGMNLF